jgi:NAD(P)-dependent dehydrogenase (short-subunit alcohol dehydrogenase family)
MHERPHGAPLGHLPALLMVGVVLIDEHPIMNISRKAVLVTGANRGIGAVLVEAFVAAGAGHVYAASREPAGGSSHPNVIPITLDVTDADQIAAAAKRCGDVVILVNNAGIALNEPLIAATDPSAAEREMRVNYFGTLNMCRAFAPIIKRRGGGAIVNLVSILGRVPLPQAGSYSASKAAVYSLTQSIRGELAGQRTLVVAVLPGFVDTEMAKTFAAPKLTPQEVARSVIDALHTETEDVYPGAAAGIAAELQRDPKAVERQFAGFGGAASHA